jgi:hypothetical protein
VRPTSGAWPWSSPAPVISVTEPGAAARSSQPMVTRRELPDGEAPELISVPPSAHPYLRRSVRSSMGAVFFSEIRRLRAEAPAGTIGMAGVDCGISTHGGVGGIDSIG